MVKKLSQKKSGELDEKEKDDRFNIGNLSSKLVKVGDGKKAKSKYEDIDHDVDNLDDEGVKSDNEEDISGNFDNEGDEGSLYDNDELDADMDEENKSDFASGAKATQLRQDAKAYSENLEKRGVVYMSRVPPFMKPNKARVLFEQFGIVTRIYLAEEDSQIRFYVYVIYEYTKAKTIEENIFISMKDLLLKVATDSKVLYRISCLELIIR